MVVVVDSLLDRKAVVVVVVVDAVSVVMVLLGVVAVEKIAHRTAAKDIF